MAFHTPEITFADAEWSHDTTRDMGNIAAHDGRDLIVFRTMVEWGDMHLLDVRADGERIGCLIWSICPELGRKVLVVNALAARPVPGVNIAQIVHERFREFAEALGCRRLRCWTKRPGLVRVLERAGFESAHHVMETACNG